MLLWEIPGEKPYSIERLLEVFPEVPKAEFLDFGDFALVGCPNGGVTATGVDEAPIGSTTQLSPEDEGRLAKACEEHPGPGMIDRDNWGGGASRVKPIILVEIGEFCPKASSKGPQTGCPRPDPDRDGQLPIMEIIKDDTSPALAYSVGGMRTTTTDWIHATADNGSGYHPTFFLIGLTVVGDEPVR